MAAGQLQKELLKRILPPPLDAGSINESKDVEFLAWTFTPRTMVLKDGHSRCFIATAQPDQESRQHACHIVREFAMQPSILEKKQKAIERSTKVTLVPLQIRVRERDLHKCGDNLALLTRFAIPSAQTDTSQKSTKKKQRHPREPLVESPDLGCGLHKKKDRRPPFKSSLDKLPGGGRTLAKKEHGASVPTLGLSWGELYPETAQTESSKMKQSQKEPTAPLSPQLPVKVAWGADKDSRPGSRARDSRPNTGSSDKANRLNKRLGLQVTSSLPALGSSSWLPEFCAEPWGTTPSVP